MRTLRFTIGAIAPLLCSACVSQFEMHTEATQVIHVALSSRSEPYAAWVISPATPEHAKLVAWVKSNQSGWSNYYATNPNNGLFVSAGDWRLQFLGESVIACSNARCLHKAVRVVEYEFLLQSRPKLNGRDDG
jgi:hypothetical protein